MTIRTNSILVKRSRYSPCSHGIGVPATPGNMDGMGYFTCQQGQDDLLKYENRCHLRLGIDNRTVMTAYLAHAGVSLGKTTRAMRLGSIQI